jgi:hypothetical protein
MELASPSIIWVAVMKLALQTQGDQGSHLLLLVHQLSSESAWKYPAAPHAVAQTGTGGVLRVVQQERAMCC